MPDGNGEHGWDKHLCEHQHLWQMLRGLTEHAQMNDKRIEALRESQMETNASVQGLIGALRELIDRIPPENVR
jgi:hypothetical protein